MAGLKSGLFYIEGKEFEECAWHITRLSLNFNLDTEQSYFVGKREFRISPAKYLLINEGNAFKTFSASSNSRMVTLAFEVGLADKLYHSLTGKPEDLLDHKPSSAKLEFFEDTREFDPRLHAEILRLTEEEVPEPETLNEQLERILLHVITEDRRLNDHLSIQRVKPSTRTEIQKRLQWSVEYARSNFHRSISVESMADEACLSLYHFKRVFKEVYNVPPYQFIRRLRLRRALLLLKEGHSVTSVCRKVGWEDPSSFIRLFKQEFGVTPSRFQGPIN